MGVRVVVVLALVAICGCEPPAASTAAKSGPPPPPSVGVQMSEVTVNDPSAEAAPAPVEPAVDQPEPSEPTSVAAPQEPTSNDDPPVADSAAPAANSEPAAPPPADSRQPVVRLSAGVALPQLLPEGTQIGVSVDYRVSGRLSTSARYALVVESSGGQVAVPVELSAQGGTIRGFLPAAVRPEHKPFKAWVDELTPGSRRSVTVSNRLDLQTSY